MDKAMDKNTASRRRFLKGMAALGVVAASGGAAGLLSACGGTS